MVTPPALGGGHLLRWLMKRCMALDVTRRNNIHKEFLELTAYSPKKHHPIPMQKIKMEPLRR